MAKITPCFENSKACVFSNLVNGLGAGTTELHIVRPVAGTLDPRYVLAYLKSPQFLLVGETKMTGTAGQKRLPKDFVEANPFPQVTPFDKSVAFFGLIIYVLGGFNQNLMSKRLRDGVKTLHS